MGHCQVNDELIPNTLIDLLMDVCIFLLIRFSEYNINTKTPNKMDEILKDIYLFVSEYTPFYHPLSFCLQEWIKFNKIFKEFQEYSALYASFDSSKIQMHR